jgi:bifunctional non-homologous end joining protein LigD
VSMPITWDELPALKRSDQWTVRTAREHLSFQTVDPWQDYAGNKQTLTAALKALGVVPAPSAAPPRKPARSARA